MQTIKLIGHISLPISHETYSGPYTIVPRDSSQTINTEDLLMRENIVVEKIPSNYGKITWDGSTMTIQ